MNNLVPPPRWRMLFEAQAAAELANLGLRYRELTRTRAEFKYPIVLLPGFGTTELALTLLNGYLKSIGAEVFDWGIGRNHGYVPDLLAQMVEQVHTLAAQRDTALHLVGWSLGGYIAREVARELPEAVAKVVTLGTPVVGGRNTRRSVQCMQNGASISTRWRKMLRHGRQIRLKRKSSRFILGATILSVGKPASIRLHRMCGTQK